MILCAPLLAGWAVFALSQGNIPGYNEYSVAWAGV